ncbi:hypothetical protein M433DRAFT_150829 [Acidomyces richmondensis BFW]|nr:MAG: hypothetical protein FE78DRAFT_86864 [Acidomyces sp. 'richmondensis']KYG48647.1 hypothetical protein M433DRAFT_150829 [Acidomyces richmondensis BFW]
MADELTFRRASPGDVEYMTLAYNYYVRESIATFQEDDSTTDEMGKKVDMICAHGLPFIVAESEQTQKICGFAYASAWAERSAYRYSVETSIYLVPDWCGQGMGKLLLQKLIDELRACGKRQALAKISILPGQSAEEVRSCRLHMSLGYRIVGRLSKVGFKFGCWIDVLVLQLSLDEQSA